MIWNRNIAPLTVGTVCLVGSLLTFDTALRMLFRPGKWNARAAQLQHEQQTPQAPEANTTSVIQEPAPTAVQQQARPYVGIQMIDLTPEIKNQVNNDQSSNLTLTEESGILIVKVVPGSPAEEAGLIPGDVIYRIDGSAVTTSREVQQAVLSRSSGKVMWVDFMRNGNSYYRDVQVKTAPDGLLKE